MYKPPVVWLATQSCTGKGPVTVLVVDTCKNCEQYQINMNAATFEEYMATTTGYIGISWQQVLMSTSTVLCACSTHAQPSTGGCSSAALCLPRLAVRIFVERTLEALSLFQHCCDGLQDCMLRCWKRRQESMCFCCKRRCPARRRATSRSG